MLTVILTGGASRRMGKDKAMLPINGQTMAFCLAKKYECLGPVAFSVDRAGRFPVGGFLELVDRYPGCGPLNGLVSAFLDTEEDVVFLTATDMPGGDPEAVRILMEQLGNYDACLFENEPLFAVYRRSCLVTAKSCLAAGEYALRSFLNKIDARQIPVNNREILENLNTKEEYEAFVKRGDQILV